VVAPQPSEPLAEPKMSGIDPKKPRFAAVVPRRLAVDREGADLPGLVEDSDHKRVVKQALDWQMAAGQASFWEMGAHLQGIERDRVYALTGQMASAGEQLSLAYAAGCEGALWRDSRKEDSPDPVDEMCIRGMGEAQCLFVVGTGHALANVAVRALAVDPTRRVELGERLGRRSSLPSFDPFSNAKEDYVSMNRETCKAIESVATASGDPELSGLVLPVVEFGRGKSWRDLDERRGEDFHRWRPQTDGIAGVPRSTPWSGDDGVGMLTIGHPVYDDARGLAEETSRIATAAMLDVASAMEEFGDKWVPPGSSIRNGAAAGLKP